MPPTDTAQRGENCPAADEEATPHALFSDPALRPLERIGELLARAISRKVRREALAAAKENVPEVTESTDDIVLFLATVGEASPKEIRQRFSLSSSTASRRLDALVIAGQLARQGSTRNLRYRPVAGFRRAGA